MKIVIGEDRAALGGSAAAETAMALKAACDRKGSATLVVATGSSQFEALAALGSTAGIPWDVVAIYHLNEYVGLSPDHPASFDAAKRLVDAGRGLVRLVTPRA